jgi:hypothetical protein
MQPQAFSIIANTIPVCAGSETGEIALQVSGGTQGYRYSADDGVSYQDTPRFVVGAGTYTVRVKDIRQCEASAQVDIITRQDNPKPDFIVATTQQASDTLMVKEISVPRPDHVTWTFDPAITVLNDDAWSPLITVKEPGEYAITMHSSFEGCAYSNTLMLTISPFDPEVRLAKDIPSRVIEELMVTPNPADGHFEVSVKLGVKQRLSVFVYDMLGIIHYKESWNKTHGITTTVNISEGAASGVYVVRAVTDTDVRDAVLIVTK